MRAAWVISMQPKLGDQQSRFAQDLGVGLSSMGGLSVLKPCWFAWDWGLSQDTRLGCSNWDAWATLKESLFQMLLIPGTAPYLEFRGPP